MTWQNKNVLITGVSGFVGSYLAEKLIQEGANVSGIVRRRADGSIPKNIKEHNLEGKINQIKGDLTDLSSLTSTIKEVEPDYIFHLAAQSYVPESFQNPINTANNNSIGTSNLLEAMRLSDTDARMVFAGTSEEYGLVFSSREQYEKACKSYTSIFPDIEDDKINELPIAETNPLRPMSPYAVSKVYGDYLCRDYCNSYGLDNVVSRAFNHEGAGRGDMFVTSVVTSQVTKLNLDLTDSITIGNVNAFRDWTHIEDILTGYMTLAQKAKTGNVYNQGSMRTNSILSYILLSLQESGMNINSIETCNGDKKIDNPTEMNNDAYYGVKFDKTKVDSLLLSNELEYTIEDKGILVKTDKDDVHIKFNPDRFRPSEVPILFANTNKIQKLGVKIQHSINDIITDQLAYYTKKYQ